MRNAENSSRLFSRLNPYFISVDALTLFPKTELYERAGMGRTEIIRIKRKILSARQGLPCPYFWVVNEKWKWYNRVNKSINSYEFDV